MADPFYMASVIFGDLGADWAQGDEPLSSLARVDFWRINAERVRGEPYYPSAPGLLDVPSPLVVETRTEVGLSFRGDREAFLSILGIDPDGVVGAVSTPGRPLDLDVLDAALEIGIGAKLVGGPTRRAVLVGLGALAACGSSDKDETPLPTDDSVGPETGLPTDTGLPSDCEDGGIRPWPRTTDELPEVLELEQTHALGTRGRGQRVAVVDSGVVPPPNSSVWLETLTVGGLSATTDEMGHGTAVIEHLRAVAPDVQVRSVKCVDNSGWANFPVAGFQRAVEIGTPPPDIVVCSWVALELSVALQREIANASERGVLVVFAAGNGTMRDTDPAEVEP
ncbi:MAG: hypothetical protein AAF211_15015, partial [Myxococcota bacterium]